MSRERFTHALVPRLRTAPIEGERPRKPNKAAEVNPVCFSCTEPAELCKGNCALMREPNSNKQATARGEK